MKLETLLQRWRSGVTGDRSLPFPCGERLSQGHPQGVSLRSWPGNLLALVAGALLPLAFAPVGFFPLAVVAPALLLVSWLHCNAKQAALRGFLFGLGLFGIGISWVYISIHDFGGTNMLVAGGLTGGFVAVLALFVALQGFLLNGLFPQWNAYKLYLAFPITWVFIVEWLRSWVLTGFPWLFLAHSQVLSPLGGTIPIIGEFGTSYLVVLSSALLYRFLSGFVPLCLNVGVPTKKYPTYLSLLFLTLIWLGGFQLNQIAWTHAVGKSLLVSLVQGNIPQEIKWEPAHVQPTLKQYSTLTAGHWNSDLIVWPEAAIPLTLQEAATFVRALDRETALHHTALITGIPIQKGFDYYNGMIALGEGRGIYFKRHLVPFGEYVPLARWLRGIIGFFDLPMSFFVSGAMNQPDLIAAGVVIAPFICYEIAYSEVVQNNLPAAALLLTVSDDAWFGNSFAPWQQLEIGRMRALETGRYFLSATNNGITAIVDAKGHIQQTSPQFKPTVLTGKIQAMQGSTPWVRWGDLPILMILLSLLGVAYLFQNKSEQ